MNAARVLIAGTVVTMAWMSPAWGGQIYTTTQNGVVMSTINPTNGTAQDLATIDRADSFGTAFNPDSVLYITTNLGSYSELSRVNPVTGATAIVGRLPRNDGALVQAIDFDSQGNLFAMGTNGELYLLRSTGGIEPVVVAETGEIAMEFIGNSAIADIKDIAINSMGHLFAVAGGMLYQIDKLSGNASAPVPIAIAPHRDLFSDVVIKPSDIQGIMFDENDVLYATACLCPSPLFSVDVSSGLATEIASTQLCNPVGGDIAPSVASNFGPLALVEGGSSGRPGTMFPNSIGMSSLSPFSGAGAATMGGGDGGGVGGRNFIDSVDLGGADLPPVAAVPEPGTLVIFAIGITGLAVAEAFRRRHRELT